MLKIISRYLLCILITAPCIDVHAMKRSVQEDEASLILSLPSHILTILAAVSKRRNTLKLVCKLFHSCAALCNWEKTVGSGHVYLSPRDQERIGANLLDENNIVLMEKMLIQHPEYANHTPSFALGKPLCFARSPQMKELLVAHGACIESEKDNVKNESLADYMGQCLRECSQGPRMNSPQLYNFFRAALKGDRTAVHNVLQSQAFKTLCALPEEDNTGRYAQRIIGEALRVAAVYGHYDIVKLLLEQSMTAKKLSPLILGLTLGDDDIWDFKNYPEQVYVPHENVAQLIIPDNRIKYLNKFLASAITSGSPAIVKMMLERPGTTITQSHLDLANQEGNAEIIKMVSDDLASGRHSATNDSDVSDSEEDSNQI